MCDVPSKLVDCMYIMPLAAILPLSGDDRWLYTLQWEARLTSLTIQYTLYTLQGCINWLHVAGPRSLIMHVAGLCSLITHVAGPRSLTTHVAGHRQGPDAVPAEANRGKRVDLRASRRPQLPAGPERHETARYGGPPCSKPRPVASPAPVASPNR